MDAKTKRSLVLLLCLCLHLKTHVCLAADIIAANQSLSGDQTIVSAGKVFELGFFKPDGNLVLFNESNTPIWSTNLASTTTSGSAQAVLLDSGNLVLRTAGSNGNTSEPLWQSFDHPAHTWLPGARIGFNTVTNQTLFLTSWKSSEDPAPGPFTLELDPNGSNAYLIFWNRSRQYWSSGAWDANSRIFSGVPEMTLNYIYNFSYVTNKNESCFTYSFIVQDNISIRDAYLRADSATHMVGDFQPVEFVLEPTKKAIKTPLHCENATSADGKQDQFKMARMSLPENVLSVKVETIAGCESICLNNCSCTAYAYNSSGCSIWIGDLFNLQESTSSDSQGITLYLRLAASDFKSPKSNKGLIIGVVAGSAAGIAILLGLIVVVILRQRKRVTGTGKAVEGSLVAFGYRDLQDATKNFLEKLGEEALVLFSKGPCLIHLS
ncbi:G-type lectin S-receptor-like serine/threonine-protein kinase [Prunus yedoensis var. nudiflora]|uniref:G-type lectin S-receptor-like serine/threonine-protein kinase n=1 Tax=Prunus yedoensis var. nudiflora TaxID=2094558 RepID=A0A314U9M1_PRUYE|nr:G-type lectin S-receptor-like serine/threonine-protein kinase [Prunus yedoensis var. nudiflora]